jgi:hypothetical protein
MRTRVTIRLIGVALLLALAASSTVGYIHFPPTTLPKMCKVATHIRVLSVKKFDKEKRIILFEVVETLKGENKRITSFRHVLRADAERVKPIRDWVGEGKRAVAFTIESPTLACGYVFIDDYCYSVDYNTDGQYWLLIRAEPALSACYHGSAKQLRKLAKDILEGKDVKVPVKETTAPPSKEDEEKRRKEVNDVFKKNRKG